MQFKTAQNHGMNRRRVVMVFDVVSRSPRLGYAHRSATEAMNNFESWEDICDFHDRRDYAGLVAYCEKEVEISPNDLYAAERLMQAYVLNADYHEAISFGAQLHRDYPSISMFSHHILDALFALGKTENGFDWEIRPAVLRLDRSVLDDCYGFLRPKRKPRDISDFHIELWSDVYVAFTDDDLLESLRNDARFVVDGTCPATAELSVVRSRKSRTKGCN